MPSERGWSKPIQTVVASVGVKPENQTSTASLVVPVLPPTSLRELLVRARAGAAGGGVAQDAVHDPGGARVDGARGGVAGDHGLGLHQLRPERSVTRSIRKGVTR